MHVHTNFEPSTSEHLLGQIQTCNALVISDLSENSLKVINCKIQGDIHMSHPVLDIETSRYKSHYEFLNSKPLRVN
jgi:hypothetical protein